MKVNTVTFSFYIHLLYRYKGLNTGCRVQTKDILRSSAKFSNWQIYTEVVSLKRDSDIMYIVGLCYP